MNFFLNINVNLTTNKICYNVQRLNRIFMSELIETAKNLVVHQLSINNMNRLQKFLTFFAAETPFQDIASIHQHFYLFWNTWSQKNYTHLAKQKKEPKKIICRLLPTWNVFATNLITSTPVGIGHLLIFNMKTRAYFLRSENFLFPLAHFSTQLFSISLFAFPRFDDKQWRKEIFGKNLTRNNLNRL